MPEEIQHLHNEEQLAVYIQRVEKDLAPSILFLHGAGQSSSSRTQYLTSRLADKGHPSLALDFSGHGASSGKLLKSSLKKRVEESLSVLPLLSTQGPLTVCGSSMGGYIALRLLQEIDRIATLVLFCPAVYSRKAYQVGFGKDFSRIIRQEESWKDTDILSTLQKFRGRLLLVIGENDEVIPEGVINLIFENAQKASSKKIIRLPDCPHKLHNWLNQRPSLADAVVTEIIKTIIQ